MRNLIVLLTALFALAACSSSPAKSDSNTVVENAESERPKPGTAAWKHGALKLPAGTPIVLSGQIDRLGKATTGFKEWLTADPAMFGEEGEQVIAQLDVYWSYLITFFGGEPDDSRSWKRRGIDPDRTFYVGIFPLDNSAREMLTTAKNVVRDTFGAAPDADIGDHLTEYAGLGPAAIPTGFNSTLQRAVEKYEPVTGARLVVPIAEKMAFESFFLGITDALEFRETTLPDGVEGRVFTDGGDFPAVRIIQDGQHAIIDLVLAPVDVSTASAEEDAVGKAVATALLANQIHPAGRPAAPAPLDDPALTLSFYQPEVATMSKLRGYQRALLAARKLSASERDQAVFEIVNQSERLASNWHRDDSGFEGLVYSLDLAGPDTNRIAGLSMTFVSEAGRSDLPVSVPKVGLGVESRSFGVSLDFGPLFNDQWDEWLGLENPSDRLDLLSDGDADPFIFGATMPRNLALIAANLASEDTDGMPDPVAEFLNRELPKIARAEIAVVPPDLTGMGSAPKFAALFVLNEQDPKNLRLTAQAARDFILASTADMIGSEIDFAKLPDLQEGWNRVEIEALPVHHTEWLPGEERRLLVVVGLTDEEAAAERTALTEQKPDEREEVLYFFARPTAFVELLADENMKTVGPFNAPILAQRLGPVVGWIKPRKTPDASAIHFRFELQRPPKL